MMKRIVSILFAVAILFTVAVIPASAGVTDQPRFIDQAGLLSEAQAASLEAKLKEYSAKNNCDIVILTAPDMNHADFTFNGTPEDYADRYYETHGYDQDGVLVLRLLDNGHGSPRIQFSCSGKCMKRLTDEEQNDIIDTIASNLSGGNYNAAFNTLADEISDKLPVRLKWYMLPLALLIGFLIAILIMTVIKGKLKTVAMQHGAASYVRPGSMHVTASRDTYLYSTVSKTARQSSSSSGSGRTSSGGGSHSGVGRNI